MTTPLSNKLNSLIDQLHTLSREHKEEINRTTAAEIDLRAGLMSLEDALYALNNEPQEEHANSSRENYRDYMAEERATTDRGND